MRLRQDRALRSKPNVALSPTHSPAGEGHEAEPWRAKRKLHAMNHLPPFQTELYFAEFEFTAPHLLSSSDCQTLSVGELLEMAGVSPQTLLDVALGYSPSNGDSSLREAIAATTEYLEPEDILVLSSPIEGLFLLSQALDVETIVLTPAYDALKNLPTRVKPWALRPTATGWELDFDTLETLVGPDTGLLVVNFPHNPTGFEPEPEEWQRLVEWTHKQGIRLFCDEMYRGLSRPGRPPLATATDLDPRALTLSGLSKAHGLPGLRAGWLATRDADLLNRLHDLKLYTSICAPSPVERLATIAVQAQEKLFARSRALVERNTALAEDFFQRHARQFHWRAPRAGSVALVELKGEGSAEAFCYRLAREHGIVLLPATFLGFPDRYVRFGLGRESFPLALAALERRLAGET